MGIGDHSLLADTSSLVVESKVAIKFERGSSLGLTRIGSSLDLVGIDSFLGPAADMDKHLFAIVVVMFDMDLFEKVASRICFGCEMR